MVNSRRTSITKTSASLNLGALQVHDARTIAALIERLQPGVAGLGSGLQLIRKVIADRGASLPTSRKRELELASRILTDRLAAQTRC